MALKVWHLTPAAAVLLCCGTAAGCSSEGSPSTTPASHAAVAARVCQSAGQAARPLLGDGTRVRVADDDPANIECVLKAGGIGVNTDAQASSQAWTEWDTATTHQAQAYGPGAVYVPSQLPHPVPGLSGNVAWIPARNELMATNGTESVGGTYVTVTVTRHSSGGPPSLAVATAVTRALLASAPRGPNGATPDSGVSATPSGTTGTSSTGTSSPSATHVAAPARLGSYLDVQDVNGDTYGVALIKIIDPAHAADQFTTPGKGKRFVGAVFTIKGISGYSPQQEDAESAAALIGSNGQRYIPDIIPIVGYTDFNVGQLNNGMTGALTFEVPTGVKVSGVQWSTYSDSGVRSTVQWHVP